MFTNRNFAAVALAILAFAYFDLVSIHAEEQLPQASPGPLPEISIGKSDAPVTIIEYSSLSCPHCAAFHRDILPALKSEYIETGKARYVVREFPLNESALAGASIQAAIWHSPRSFFQNRPIGLSNRMRSPL